MSQIKSKEEIHFEESNKILPGGIYPGMANDKTYNAMEVYAEQEAIAFAEWEDLNTRYNPEWEKYDHPESGMKYTLRRTLPTFQTTNKAMSCIKNPKKLLGIKYNGPHMDRIVRFGRFMHGSNDFVTLFECVNCGAQYTRSFVSEEELLEYGVPLETIVKNRTTIY